VARTRITKAITTSQNAKPERTGIATNLATTPTTPITTATHQVFFFGADYFTLNSNPGRVEWAGYLFTKLGLE